MPSNCSTREFFPSFNLQAFNAIWKSPNMQVMCLFLASSPIENTKDMAITHEPDKYEGVLLVSGDGLVNQFVNGLMER